MDEDEGEGVGWVLNGEGEGEVGGEGGDKNVDVTGRGVKGRGWVKTRMGMLQEVVLKDIKD